MKISHGIEYWLARMGAFIFCVLPRTMALSLGDRLGRGVNNLWRSRNLIVMKNLEIAFGDELSEADREVLSREVFGNIGRTIVEICRFSKIKEDRMFEMVSSEGEDGIAEMRKYGRGGILVGAHFGNWEVNGGYVNHLGYPVSFLVRGQHNKKFDDYLSSLRLRLGIGLIHSERTGEGSGMKEVLRTLKDNRMIAIVSDQHAGSGGIIVKFFGRLVSVPRAPATLSVRTGAPLLFGYSIRRDDGSLHCVFNKPLYPNSEADRDQEILRLTQAYTGMAEVAIRKYPQMWLWTHRRFKDIGGPEMREGVYVD